MRVVKITVYELYHYSGVVNSLYNQGINGEQELLVIAIHV